MVTDTYRGTWIARITWGARKSWVTLSKEKYKRLNSVDLLGVGRRKPGLWFINYQIFKCN